MQLSVAKRIILGFTVITTLLIITSLNTLYRTSHIRSATHQINSTTIPAILSAEKLEVALSQMQINQVAGYVEDDATELQMRRNQTQQHQQLYRQELSKLTGLIGGFSHFPSILSSMDEDFKQITQLGSSMFDQRQRINRASTQITNTLDNIENTVDEASSLLLDFIDTVSEQDEYKAAIATADSLDASLMSWVELTEELLQAEEVASLDSLRQEQEFLSRDLTLKAEHLLKSITSDQDRTLLEEPIDIIKQLMKENQQSSNLYALHKIRLQAGEEATRHYNQGRTVAIELNQLIVELNEAISALTAENQQSAERQITTANKATIAIMVISIVLAIGITWLVVRSIIMPMKKVNKALAIIASGNLTQQLDASKQDEFGQLAANVNSLTNNLKQLVNAIISRSTQLAAAAEETSSITTGSTQATLKQKDQVSQVATATTQMSSTAEQVESIAQDTRQTILNADSETQHTIELATQSQQALLLLTEEVSQASTTITQLHDDTASISSILDVIRGVAEQTNLLALNAAIEAARAGEQGRGFAVVADEVRNLASRTQDSTQEISEMIVRLQGGAQQAVAAMEKGEAQAQQCVAQTEESNVALQAITKSVHQAVEMSSQISQAAQEQNLVTNDINQKLESIVGITEETAKGADQTALSSQEVARLAEELQQSISKFTV